LIDFRCLNKFNNFIKRRKDKNALDLNNNIAYKIYYKNCNASYIGQIKRQLKRGSQNIKKLIQNISRHIVTNYMI